MESQKLTDVITNEEPKSSWTEFKIYGRVPNARSSCASFLYGSNLYIYGGIDIKDGPLGDLYSIDLSLNSPEWTKINLKGVLPKNIYRHSGALKEDIFFVIGGMSDMDSTNQIYSINLKTSNSEMIEAKGQKIAKMDSNTSLISGNIIYVFGGYMNYEKSNKTFAFNISDYSWEHFRTFGKLPPKRANHSASLFENQMFIFGGSNNLNEKLNDLWVLNLASKEWKKIESLDSPLARSGQSSNMIGSKMIIFGGSTGVAKETRELYLYDIKSNTWNLLNPHDDAFCEASSPRSLGKMIATGNQSNRGSPKSNNSIDSMSPYDKRNSFRNTAVFYDKNEQNGKNEKNGKNGKKFTLVLNKTIRTKYNANSVLQSVYESARKLKKQAKNKKLSKTRQAKPPVTPTNLNMKNSFIFNSQCKRLKNADFTSLNRSDSKFRSCKIPGGIPGPRDGHTSVIFENKLIIFGGDRHQMAFNDLYEFTIDIH